MAKRFVPIFLGILLFCTPIALAAESETETINWYVNLNG
jgi:hypothetical protein